jgi:hypothetical protein
MIPPELLNLPQWLAWYYDSEGTKVPVGKSNDPKTWRMHSELKGTMRAFVIEAGDPYTGVDLDDCVTDDGFTPEAAEVLERFRGIAYAEISPSGTGIKLLTRASKPEGSACSFDKWLECYDHARFWTVTGNVIEGFEEIGDGQEGVDWLCRKYLTPEKPKPKFVAPPKTVSHPLAERARAYVDAADRPSEGGRNNTAFRLAGHLAAIVGEYGDRLSEDEIVDYLRSWNCKLSDPLPDCEIEKVARSAMNNGTPRDDKPATAYEQVDILDINWDELNATVDSEEDIDDEQFCLKLVPSSGLMRMVFEFYGQQAYRRSVVMGLAVSVALCQTIFGRKVRSHTDLRTNDYNLILATTGSGKEACEATITKILDAADPGCRHMIPPDVQSGNGLMRAVSSSPCAIWVCDEFGKILQAVLDKKGNQHIKNIGHHLLKLYGKSNGTYGGAAHSDGIRNRIVQPHLCVLGLSTGSTVFESIATEQVADGLIGRIAFWPVQDRPDPRDDMTISEPGEKLVETVRDWIDFEPGENNLIPTPETVNMSSEALKRWQVHSKQINERMKSESEMRAAVWSRVAARTMKLSLVHRCSRLEAPAGMCQWDFVQIELIDVQWAVCLSNWLARISCGLIRENVFDKSGSKAKSLLMKALTESPEGVNCRALLRACRSITAGDLQAAADEMGLLTENRSSGGRPSKWYMTNTNSS